MYLPNYVYLNLTNKLTHLWKEEVHIYKHKYVCIH